MTAKIILSAKKILVDIVFEMVRGQFLLSYLKYIAITLVVPFVQKSLLPTSIDA